MTRLKRIHTLNSGFRVVLIASVLLSLILFRVPPGTAVEGQSSLTLTKTASATSQRQATLNIEKSASPSNLTLNGESKTVTYVIEVTRTEEDEIRYTVSGIITAATTGENPAYVTKVEDVVEYRVGGEGWVTAGSTVISDPESPVPVGGSVNYEYTVTFTLPADVTPTAMRNNAYVTISNRGGHNADEPYHTRASFDVPTPDSESSTVQVTDSESITPSDGGVSFSVDSVTWDGGSSTDPDGPWSLNAPNTITIVKTVTASATATPGTYMLENTASIVDGPSDPAEVTITVPERGGGTNGGNGGGGTGGGGTGGGATQEPVSLGQGGPLVVQEQPVPTPAPPVEVAPTAVARAAAPSAPLPKKLPYTGFDFRWYGLISILLIVGGSLLQSDSISEILIKSD